ATLGGSGGPIRAVALGAEGRWLATAAAGGANGRGVVTLWHPDTGRAIRSFEAGPPPVGALATGGDRPQPPGGAGADGVGGGRGRAGGGVGYGVGHGAGGIARGPGPRGPGPVPGVPPGRGAARRCGLQ